MSDSPQPDEDLADVLTRELWAKIRSQAPTKVRPRKAATLILLDRSGPQVRLLMGKRHANHAFMPGVFVFPGGGVEPGDRQMSIAGALDPVTEAKLVACLDKAGSPAGARALALAAIRETFEETGLALGASDYGAPEGAPEGAWSDFAALGVFPMLEDLHFIGRSVTPPRTSSAISNSASSPRTTHSTTAFHALRLASRQARISWRSSIRSSCAWASVRPSLASIRSAPSSEASSTIARSETRSPP